jgi:aminobenzoyl-glutamate utilization protein B
MDMWRIVDKKAQAATLMTDTTFTSRLLGSAWPGYFNKPIAEDMYRNIKQVGLPQWSDDDQALARAVQRELKAPVLGLATKIPELRAPQPQTEEGEAEGNGVGPTGGGSDDIGDISWNVPTVTLRFPSNLSGGPGHNWANAITMATPIAYKGVIAGAKVQAMTVLDMLLHPELLKAARDYFGEQTKTVKYKSFLRPEDQPAIWLNQKTMETYRDRMKQYYYDPARYGTYLEQLGIHYPTLQPPAGK